MNTKVIPTKEIEVEKMLTTGMIMLVFGLLSVFLFPTENLFLSLLIFTSALIVGTILCVLGVVKAKKSPIKIIKRKRK